MNTKRIEAFSDGIFAISITLLVLDIHRPDSTEHLAHDLAAQWSSYVAYAISFLLIGMVWANHHTMFDRIARSDRTLMTFNTFLMMDVAFLPFPTAVMAQAMHDHAGLRVACLLYGGTLVIGGIFFSSVWQHAIRGRRLLADHVPTEEARYLAKWFALGPVMYLIATLIAIVSPIVAIGLFLLLIAIYTFDGLVVRTH